jgi:hypothetical protein
MTQKESRQIHRSGKTASTKKENSQRFPFLNNRQNMIFYAFYENRNENILLLIKQLKSFSY